MKKLFLLTAGIVMSCLLMAEMEPVYYEGFSRCFDEEDENYGYTGGNDNLWGGDIAKAVVIYQDAPEWTFEFCNGANRCLKVGTSAKQGKATTPAIECEGEAVLTFRVAPWEGDSIFYVSIQGGTTSDQTMYHLKKHQWTNVTIRIADIKNAIRITFTSTNKHRFFLDDVCVRPADPDKGVIRTAEGTMLDFGLLGRHYQSSSRTIHVEGVNLKSSGISASLEDGEPNLFSLSTSTLPAEGGELTVTSKTGASEGQHGCYLYLRGKDAQSGEKVEKKVTVMMEVASLDLQGSGTKPDPYTCADVVLLAANAGTVWSDTYYWVTGYVLGGVKRYTDTYDGISLTDDLSLVLADSPDETNDNRYVTVQISENARAALNVVDNPELIKQSVKVQGVLLNDKANPLYLGKPGVRNVRTDAQYVRPDKETGIDHVQSDKVQCTKVMENGVLYLMYKGTKYNVQGKAVK